MTSAKIQALRIKRNWKYGYLRDLTLFLMGFGLILVGTMNVILNQEREKKGRKIMEEIGILGSGALWKGDRFLYLEALESGSN